MKIVSIQAMPTAKNTHATIFLFLPGLPMANINEDVIRLSVEHGPNITNNRMLIKP